MESQPPRATNSSAISSADFTIQTANAGTLNGLLTVTHEDEKGNAKTLTKEFSMTVEEMQMGGAPAPEADEPPFPTEEET